MYAGHNDVRRAAELLAVQLPPQLEPLASIAYNYRWCWQQGGAETLAAVNPHRWRMVGENPVAMLAGSLRTTLDAACATPGLVERVQHLDALIAADLARPPLAGPVTPERPVAFLCAEFGIHASMPIYSGGLGVLAGDILKQASDLGFPMVAVGLMYQVGYFHQRVDRTGYQHEYWIESDPHRLPVVHVTGSDGLPLKIKVPLEGRDLAVQVWRCDVGRVPLYLLDTNLDENPPTGRWVTARLYEGNRSIRLAQYAVLGVGGVRALAAMGIDPVLYHLNEGHPALGSFEVQQQLLRAGHTADEAWHEARSRFVFTTHTPVQAGNETYEPAEIMRMLAGVSELAGGEQRFLSLGRINPGNSWEQPGMTPLAIRVSRSVNGVSQRHGAVARQMWHGMFGDRPVDEVPITHVTNGVHVPTWLQGPMRDLLDRHLDPGWLDRVDEPATWSPVADIPDAELWAARNEARRQMIARVKVRATTDRLRRGEMLDYAEAAERQLQDDVLTIGFARRIASYKRLHLIAADPVRALRLLDGDRPIQFLFAGKAHPLDEGAKAIVQALFQLKDAPQVAGRVAFLEDYDLTLASILVAGCDVWVNVPRPPQEASGTSGMKVAMNGGLNLSVLDGWWCEAYDGTNGWAVDGAVDPDEAAQDQRHATQLFDLLESEVIPAFHDRDASGVPRTWVARIKRSLMTIGPQFSARRMVREYVERIYPA